MRHLIKYPALVLLLAGCASSTSVDILQEGPKVQQVYSKGTGALDSRATVSSRYDDLQEAKKSFSSVSIYQPDIRGWSRDSRNEINGLFPKLPNPVITVYVYPHMATTEALPVPGYATQMNLYVADQFALPSELPRTHPDAQYKKIVVNGIVKEL